MMPGPEKVGAIHFIGIGGIGMSGIAEMLAVQGYQVQGSDAAEGYTLDRLRGLGVTVFVGHQASNVSGARVIVVSSAIRPDNAELVAARAAGVAVVKRAEMLAELMKSKQAVAVAGTHGKTTTTTMVAAVLEAGGLDPSVVNGGIINAYGSNAKTGQGDWMVVEADESDGTFLKLPASVAVVTNVDPEHLDHFKTYENVKAAFRSFIENVPFYGFAVVCADHAETMAIAGAVQDRRVLSYGFGEGADVRATGLNADRDGMSFDVTYSARMTGGTAVTASVRLPMPGRHNVSNALAALTVARELGVSDADAAAGLAAFEGVQRRFTKVGDWNGVTIIDDYSHNPPKIAAAIEAARQVAGGRVIAIMQPHRFTRVRDLFDGFVSCMDGADVAVVSDIYTAGETPIEGITGPALVEAMQRHGHADARFLPSPDDLPGLVLGIARPGDYVIVLGAGSNTTWAKKLPAQLAALG
jgi:UDP-N-acetylmuramate--alanine ligase